MTCRELADFIMDYLEGALPGEVRTRFEHHLTLCPDCIHYLAAYKATIELNRSVRSGEATETAASELPDTLVNAILASRRP